MEKNEKEKQVKNSFIYLITMGVSGLLPVLTLPIFTRILSPKEYGILALADIYTIFIANLAQVGLLSIFKRNLVQYHDNKKLLGALIFSILTFIIVIFIFFGLLTYIFGNYITEFFIHDSSFKALIMWELCAKYFEALSQYILEYYKYSENAKKFSLCTIVRDALYTLLALILIAGFKVGIMGLVYARFVSWFIILIVMIQMVRKTIPFSLNGSILKDTLFISYPLTIGTFTGIVSGQFDKYMLGLLRSIGAVGVYGISQKISLVTFNFMTALQNVFQPRVFKLMFAYQDNGSKEIGHYQTKFIYLSVAFALNVALFSEEIVYFLTAPAFHSAIDIIIIFSLFYGVMFFGKQQQLIFKKKTKTQSILSIIGISLSISFNILFIKRWGIYGAAWAALLSGFLSVTIFFIFSQHHYKIDWEYGKIIQMYGILFGSSFLLLLLRRETVDYPLRLAFKCCCILMYLYIGYNIKILTKENVRMIFNLYVLKKA